MSMDKHYDPSAIEALWYPWWEKSGQFKPTGCGKPYSMVIPPPNVTGILHMGHALNDTIQDTLARWRRMQGYDVLWVPGTDHAGIATQNVVEKALRAEGKRRQDLGREKFVERVWEWRKEYGGTIVRQLRRLGCSCDWTRERFTMDEGLSRAVAEVFCQMYAEDLIYRGNYIVNWCPRCGTALADDEIEHEPNDGYLWHVRYRVEGSEDEFVQVATTRPETLPGDTAVAVNPSDERYLSLHGKYVILPLSNRRIPIVADDYVERDFGTGVVKITPAHDPNDFQVAMRRGLEAVNIMNEDGTMNGLSGYEGMDRFACREKIVQDLEAGGHMVKVEKYQNSVGHCYRCHTVVESRLSKQWFVRMKPLAHKAMEVVRNGSVTFTPKRYEATYFEWMENIRDWCISRQIWWGHRIPVYYCDCGHVWAQAAKVEKCPECGASGAAVRQDEDVLDTWFSSWLWPFSTLGWPNCQSPDLKRFYPTHDLCTAPDIIFFWVARMIMAGCKFMGEVPFRNVVLHGVVRDDQGRKMSKSLGNSIDPIKIIERYSADSLRFTLMQTTSPGVDIYVSMDKFEIGRNFGTKIWNAARFMQMHMEKTSGLDWREIQQSAFIDASELTDDDRHLLAKCDDAVVTVTECLERYRFQDAALAVYDFTRSSYCDRYLETIKGDLGGDDHARRETVLRVATHVFSKALRLIHPFMPFVTEEIWHQLSYAHPEESIMRAPWPSPFTDEQKNIMGLSQELTDYVDAKYELITVCRALRATYGIPPAKQIRCLVLTKTECDAKRLRCDTKALLVALRAEEITIGTELDTAGMPGNSCALGSVHLSLAGLVDVPAELARVSKDIAEKRKFLAGVDAKLANESFVSRAPEQVVAQQRETKSKLESEIEHLEKLAATLIGAR